MIELPVIPANQPRRKPDWLRVKLPVGKEYAHVRGLVDTHKLYTICESGNCPNMGECWGAGTATFMILWNICTMPNRAFDVGIAEQHAVIFSAGIATQGMIPFCNIYSSFMQRAYDQVIHDVAIQNLNVVFCLDRAGIAGADGPTHHGAYDLAYMRCIPNMTVSAPMNEEELRNLMFTAQQDDMGPFVIRYPRGQGVMPDWKRPFTAIPVGKGRKIHDGLWAECGFDAKGIAGNVRKLVLNRTTRVMAS